jgi:hypothetical protein
MIAVTTPLFTLGKVLATPGALEALDQAHQPAWELISLHVAGTWGVVGAKDAEANNQALKDGSRLLSAYILRDGKTKIWVITEAEDDNGNRAATTLLLPSEY